MKKLLLIILFVVSVVLMYGAAKEEIAFDERLERTRYPVELDFKGTPLSDALSIISKTSNVTIVASSTIANLPIDLYLPKGQTLKRVIDTIKSTNGLTSKVVNDTMILSKDIENKITIGQKGKVVGKVVEIDKLTGIKGVTLSLGDDVNTLVLSDVGGAFIINDVEPGTYILKATMRDYRPSGEIVEVKAGGVTQVEVVLTRLQGTKGIESLEKENKELGKVIDKNGAIADTEKVEILYADPKEVKESLEKIVTLDSIAIAGNSLILKGISDNLKTAKNMITDLDKPKRQVRIKAKIWDVKKEVANTLGMDMLAGRASKNESSLSSVWPYKKAGNGTEFGNVAMGSTGMKLNFTGFLGSADDVFSLTLDMLKQTQDSEITAEPSVVTLDGKSASINITQEVIVGQTETTDDDGKTTKEPLFKEAGVVMEVTPTVKPDGKTVELEIYSKISRFIPTTNYDATSAEDKQETKTKIIVRNGETIRIGGLTRVDRGSSENKVPILGDIPVLGTLFKKNIESNVERNLYVEITPEIIELGRNAVQVEAAAK